MTQKKRGCLKTKCWCYISRSCTISSSDCEENICFGLNTLSKKQQFDRAEKLEQILNIVDIKHRYPDQISGGQQQRVAIARAIAPVLNYYYLMSLSVLLIMNLKKD